MSCFVNYNNESTTYIDLEKKGGAAIAAFRLNEAMNRYGIDSKMLVCRVSAHSSENPYLRNARWIKIKQSFLSHCSQLFQKYCLKSEFVFSLGHFWNSYF